MQLNRRQFVKTTASASLALAATAAMTNDTDAAAKKPLPIVDCHQHLWDLSKFNLAWVDGLISKLELSPRLQDVQATLAELTATAIGDAVRDHAADSVRVLICGGGSKNLHLMDRLQARLQGRSVSTTAEFGLDPDWVEAAVFAWLAKETIAGRPIDLPAMTGSSKAAILGGIYSV